MDLAIDARLAHAPRDQLRDLQAKSTMRTKSWTMRPHVAQSRQGNGATRKVACRARASLPADRRHDEVDKRPHLGWPVMARG
jgi:hypothetical protein